MSPIGVIAFWLVVLAVFYSAMRFLRFLFEPVYQWGKLRDYKVILFISRIPGFLAKAVPIGLILMFTLSIGREIALTTFPSYAFKSTFGFSIDSDTEVLKNYRGALLVTDYQEICLKLQTKQNVVDKITRNNFRPISREEFIADLQRQPREPGWFKSLDSEPTQFYKSDPFNDHYDSNSAILCYNESSGICYFHYIGVD